MTPGATATTIDRRTAHIEYDAYLSSTPATTAVAPARPTAPAPRQEGASLVPLGEAFAALVGLKENWDSYGALPPSKRLLEYTWNLASRLVEIGLPIPQVFPTTPGGVQLEWHQPGTSLEWEIDPNAAGGVFTFDDRQTGERIDGEIPDDLDDLAEALNRTIIG